VVLSDSTERTGARRCIQSGTPHRRGRLVVVRGSVKSLIQRITDGCRGGGRKRSAAGKTQSERFARVDAEADASEWGFGWLP